MNMTPSLVLMNFSKCVFDWKTISVGVQINIGVEPYRYSLLFWLTSTMLTAPKHVDICRTEIKLKLLLYCNLALN